ncbi:dynein axonemal heavy chain 6 isoform X1 [Tachysurus ichikawai]
MSSHDTGGSNGEDGARRVPGGRTPVVPLSLPPVDTEMLMSRLRSTGPCVPQHDPNALVITPLTFKKLRKRSAPKPMHQELQPALKKIGRFVGVGWMPPTETTDPRSSLLHLPPISDHLKEKQVQLPQSSIYSTRKGRSSIKSRTSTLSPDSLTPTPPTSKPLQFSSVEEVISAGIRSPRKITQIIRNNPHLGFFYMTTTKTSQSCFDLKIVPYAELDKSNYYTISEDGVTHYSNDGLTLTSLERWEQEYFYHQRLQRIPTFALFRKIKAFHLWRGNVRYKITNRCKCALQESLFIINESLRPALINVRELCYRISDMSLCKIEKHRMYTLEEFQSDQYTQLNEVSARLREFRELVKEVALTACNTSMLEAGYLPDYCKDGDENKPCADLEFPDNMVYCNDLIKKCHCNRLTCFIRLADYLIMSSLHTLTFNSISKLLSLLQEHKAHTPSHTLILSWVIGEASHDTDNKDSVSEQKAEASVLPMFITELMMDTHALFFQPSIKDFQEVVAEIISRFQETVLFLQPLVKDSDFDAFTQPIINNKV